MNRFTYSVAIALLPLTVSNALAQGERCASIESDKDRLACYDSIWRTAPAQPAQKATAAETATTSWTVVRNRDQLSGKTITHAQTNATQQFKLGTEPVSSSLVVQCVRVLKGDPGELRAHIWFSQRVAVGRTWGRVRIDDGPVQAVHPDSSSRGNTIDVFFPKHGGEGMRPLIGTKRLRVELDLPTAGKVLLEFPTVGAKEAFSKLTCLDPEY